MWYHTALVLVLCYVAFLPLIVLPVIVFFIYIDKLWILFISIVETLVIFPSESSGWIFTIYSVILKFVMNLICCMRLTGIFGNVGNMSATCRHKRHVSVISGQHDNSADTDHHISRVVSKFDVLVCTISVFVLKNHNRTSIYRPHLFLMWWHTHNSHPANSVFARLNWLKLKLRVQYHVSSVNLMSWFARYL